ncbi:histamine receptor H2a [Cololabis saira]|uniref:histamine receptor H2a n=1 Tax=Cololabis saira TaxID=129043 RepID=UPI002AD4618A|nr:histamine receptor H2a [Cololabis saira]
MLGVILSLLILMTVGGNVLVCLAVCASRRLRCLTNCFIVSLAVTDLLLGLLVLPFSALLQLNDDWPLGPVFCNFYISMDVMLCTASILTLLAISVDRYLAVTLPLRYTSLVLPWRVAVAMAGVWTVSVAVSFLPIQMGWNTVNGTVQNQGPWASERSCRFELNRPYVLTDSLVTFYLPLVAMCWTYLRILQIARAQAKRNNNPSTCTTLVSSATAVVLREHKATVTLAAVIGAFVVCWLPYFILFTVLGLEEHPDPGVVPEFPVVLWLGYANSALNPILYGALNRDFSVSVRRQPSPTITTAGGQLTGATLRHNHAPATSRAAIVDQNVMLQEINCTTAKSTIRFANGTAVTNISGPPPSDIQSVIVVPANERWRGMEEDGAASERFDALRGGQSVTSLQTPIKLSAQAVERTQSSERGLLETTGTR